MVRRRTVRAPCLAGNEKSRKLALRANANKRHGGAASLARLIPVAA